jgi:hypothetical protein
MALPFHRCDDVHDAAADALREVIAAALQVAEVEDQQPPP